MFCACCAAKTPETNGKEDAILKRNPEAEESIPSPTGDAGGSRSKSTGKKTGSSGCSRTQVVPPAEHSDLWVCFDAVDFRCRSCSKEMESLVGVLSQDSLILDVLGGDELRRTVQQSINELCYSEDAPRRFSIKNVPIRPTDGSKPMMALVTLDFGEMEESIELDAFVIEARLYDLQEMDAEAQKAVKKKKVRGNKT
mmetsp:Transcript_98832/g.316848  ORF Transcript_98832/g.316848 Transcript_98832/m.316848 type:complete len:197 (+) Transcript_98832:104-694(+)|eukprot:CAMPEP_0203870766 /NCGR_PEP_ID=MMETSP0359-20131031/18400_1 /ASSEMBLY_ACC=CAM_ASM_000338 /TAXON_ID=268821 /ORGANISM="Scrippsiella Hangoei, Strain SHTV-5" /LENGTH=196 /DNA_ID=CAMNT_0050789437 /DNA_START=50 /DNA_END=640 /DNA_ORIENTATION=-